MPSVSKRQQRFFGAELGRKRAGKKTVTGLGEKKLKEFAGSVKGLGEVIQNTGGKTPFGKDKFGNQLNAPASVKPKGGAIDVPTYDSPTMGKKRSIFQK